MTVSVTKIAPITVSGPGDGIHITKADLITVSGPGDGIHITKIVLAVVIDTTPISGRRRQTIVC